MAALGGVEQGGAAEMVACSAAQHASPTVPPHLYLIICHRVRRLGFSTLARMPPQGRARLKEVLGAAVRANPPSPLLLRFHVIEGTPYLSHAFHLEPFPATARLLCCLFTPCRRL